MGSDAIPLGKNRYGKTVRLYPKTRRTHMHIAGASGEGKSKFMEHLIRSDISNNEGLCLIDPHGYLYNDIVRWCESKRMLDRSRPKKIILFDPSQEGWTFGFNPLSEGLSEISFHVDAMVRAVAKVWGGEDTDRTPLLKRCLRVIFHTLAEKNLSLYEAQHLIDPVDEEIRKYLTRDIKDVAIKKQWNYFNSLKAKPFYDEFGSSINRMMEFLASPIIRNVVGQIERTIDFRKIMDEGWVLLVNLASSDKVSDDNARLLGTLIVNDLFMRAKGRPKGSRPFYLYIDECARYINEDIGRILDEGRKFGLHLILAHQHLSQLKEAGESVYRAVMQNARTKVIFGGWDPEEARVLAELVFMGEFDLEEPKASLNKPVVVRYIKTWMENYSHSTSSTSGGGYGSGRGGGSSRGGQDSRTVVSGDGQVTYNYGSSYDSSDSWSDSFNSFDSETESEARGRSETLAPVLEERPTETFSLEEQIYRAMALMVNQPERHAIIKLPKTQTNFVKTPFVKDGHANERRIARFKENSYKLTEFAQPIARVEAQIEERQQLLLEQAKEKDDVPRPVKAIKAATKAKEKVPARPKSKSKAHAKGF